MTPTLEHRPLTAHLPYMELCIIEAIGFAGQGHSHDGVYVMVSLDSSAPVYATSTTTGSGVNPVWNETATIQVPATAESIYFSVRHWNPATGNILLGRCRVPLGPLLEGEHWFDLWASLQDRRSSLQYTQPLGKLRIKARSVTIPRTSPPSVPGHLNQPHHGPNDGFWPSPLCVGGEGLTLDIIRGDKLLSQSLAMCTQPVLKAGCLPAEAEAFRMQTLPGFGTAAYRVQRMDFVAPAGSNSLHLVLYDDEGVKYDMVGEAFLPLDLHGAEDCWLELRHPKRGVTGRLLVRVSLTPLTAVVPSPFPAPTSPPVPPPPLPLSPMTESVATQSLPLPEPPRPTSPPPQHPQRPPPQPTLQNCGLSLTIYEARDLAKMEGVGEPHAGVHACWGAQSPFYTTKVMKGRHPVWNEGFANKPMPPRASFLSLLVFHKSLLGHEHFLGVTRIALEAGMQMDKWCRLECREGDVADERLRRKRGGCLGELRIKLQCTALDPQLGRSMNGVISHPSDPSHYEPAPCIHRAHSLPPSPSNAAASLPAYTQLPCFFPNTDNGSGGLPFRPHHNWPAPQHLQLVVVGASGLVGSGLTKKANPYCAIGIGSELPHARDRTTVAKSTVAPRWAQSFSLTLPPTVTHLTFTVWDEPPVKLGPMGSDKFLGQVCWDITPAMRRDGNWTLELLPRPNNTMDYLLQAERSKLGFLHIVSTWRP
eukprot:GGOE01057925.1.p1 GENE.GGOE01057925.1~~GGOE01057925.1.p1  ORF type:complete len:822 (-),score=171.57 GGOE01057925.1:218-2332(-)